MDASSIEVGKASLAVEILKTGGTLRLRATGSSMLPSLWPGDVLTIEACTIDQAQRGDIVLFTRNARFFIHRVRGTSVQGGYLTLLTRGDSVPHCDPPVSSEQLLGKVTLVQRSPTRRRPSTLSAFKSLHARLLAHSDLCRRIALRLHSRRIQPWPAREGARTVWTKIAGSQAK